MTAVTGGGWWPAGGRPVDGTVSDLFDR